MKLGTFQLFLAHLKDFLKNSKQVVLLHVGKTFVSDELALVCNILNMKQIRETDGFLSFFNCFNSFFSSCFVKFLYISVKLRLSSYAESTNPKLSLK